MAAKEVATDRAGVKSRSSRSRHDHSRRRANPHLTRKYLTLKKRHKELERIFLGSTLGLGLLSCLLGGWAFKETRSYRQAMHSRYLESTALAEAKKDLEATRQQLATLVEGRIPELRPFAGDSVISVGDRYVRNVGFTVARRDGRPAYEYKLVAHNDTDIMVLPRVTILMFDSLGIEIGRSTVPPTQGDGPVVDHTLYPNEVESFDGTISVSPGTDPAYFKLVID